MRSGRVQTAEPKGPRQVGLVERTEPKGPRQVRWPRQVDRGPSHKQKKLGEGPVRGHRFEGADPWAPIRGGLVMMNRAVLGEEAVTDWGPGIEDLMLGDQVGQSQVCEAKRTSANCADLL